MKVDAHIHFWRLARGDNTSLSPTEPVVWRDYEPDSLRPLLDAAGIDAIIAVQAAPTLAETLYTLGLAERYPWISAVVGWIDPRSPSLAEELDALIVNPRFSGVRPILDDNASIGWMLDARHEPCWQLLADRGLVLEFLVQNPDEVPLVTHFAGRHLELTIVLDHCAKPDIAGGRLQPWAGDMLALARHENVSCKFSALPNSAQADARADAFRPYSDALMGAFGPGRLMWASDWPPLLRASAYGTWRQVSLELLNGLSPSELDAVLGGNASRVYRLQSWSDSATSKPHPA
ncbi:MAG: amidohydrolase family protein [Hyphomicrobiales bacterium]|nr:amidohydrolase family protein [Hyphomicrobiales bacterium]